MTRRDLLLAQWKSSSGEYLHSFLGGEEVDVWKQSTQEFGYREIGSAMFERLQEDDWLRFPARRLDAEDVRLVFRGG